MGLGLGLCFGCHVPGTLGFPEQGPRCVRRVQLCFSCSFASCCRDLEGTVKIPTDTPGYA